MRPRAWYAIALACAVVWLGSHWGRLTAADPFADPIAAHRMPPQQDYVHAEMDPRKVPTFFQMDDSFASLMIVQDIAVYPDPQRWTMVKPTLKFFVPVHHGERFVMDFYIASATFVTTGPVTLTVTINGHVLGRLKCAKPGDFHFEQAVPDNWFAGSDSTVVEAPVDKLWTSPQDGARLGYLLKDVGFVR